MNKRLLLYYISAVQLLLLFNFFSYVEATDEFYISGNKSEIHQVTKNNIESEYEKLRREKITPWSFFNSGHPITVIDFYGKEIKYSGVKFEGSPELTFWSGFIEPFLKDIIFRTFDNTIHLCREKKLYSAEPIRETGQLLKVLVSKVYSDMADVDRRLRGGGYPQNIKKKDVSDKVQPILNLINERVDSELSLRNKLNEFYDYNQGLIWLAGISISIAWILIARNNKKKKVRLKIDMTIQALSDNGDERGDLSIVVYNTGDRDVSLYFPRLLYSWSRFSMPQKEGLILLNNNAERYPVALPSHESHFESFDLSSIAKELNQKGYSGIKDIKAEYQDTMGKFYFGKTFQFDIDRWLPKAEGDK
jgi:hypothetical protein